MSASAAAEAASVSATSACTGTVLGDIEDLVREPCSCPLCASLCVGVPGTLSASDALALKETLGGSVCALLARTTFTTVGGAIVLRPKTAGEPGGHTSGFPVQRGACTFLDARTGCTLTYGAGKPAECCSSYQCIQTPDQILAMVDQHVSKHLRDAVKNYAIEHASIAGMARCAPARAGRFTVADIDTFKERLKEHLAAITDGYQHIGVTPSVSLTEFLNALRVTALRRVLQFARQR